MKAGEILINGIFNGSRLLEVPFYQRAYVWKEEQWERFLDDLRYVTIVKKQYFMGSIILKSGDTLNTWDKYSECKVVIDGQQRLTTLLVFMKVLCLKNNQNNLFVKPILETNEENNGNLNINKENEKNINNKKIMGNNNIKMNNNKYMGTLISVTSSEFREGCRGLESFMSTIKFDDTKK